MKAEPASSILCEVTGQGPTFHEVYFALKKTQRQGSQYFTSRDSRGRVQLKSGVKVNRTTLSLKTYQNFSLFSLILSIYYEITNFRLLTPFSPRNILKFIFVFFYIYLHVRDADVMMNNPAVYTRANSHGQKFVRNLLPITPGPLI